MKKYLPHIVVLLCAVAVTQKAIAQVSGVKTIPGDYNSITDAIQQLSIVGVNGPTYLELQPAYNSTAESFPIIIRKIPGTTDTRPVTISPAAGASALSIISTTHEFTIELIGAHNIIIDGRPGRQGTSRELTIRNDYVPGHAVGFFDGAVSNKVTHCIIEGRSLAINTSRDGMPVGGTVMFGRSLEPLPVNTLFENTSNTLSHCKIVSINGGVTGIYSDGDDAVRNVNNTIVNNEISNFHAYGFLATGFSSGWTITGNSIYNQLANNGLHQTGIMIHSFPDALVNTISGNFIGGHAADAGGEKWEGQNITGISVHQGTYTIENNVIRNMSITGAMEAVSFAGILFSSEAGTIAENQIGGTSLSNSITVTGPAFTVVGIQSSFCFPTPIIDNRISYINATQEGSLTNPNTNSFIGITAGPFAQLSGNEVDQLTLTSTDDITFVFIKLVSRAKCPQWSDQPGATTTIHYNRTHSLKIASEDGEANVTGIEINERLAGNTGNIIGSATAANSIQVSGKNAVISGILVDGEAEYVSLSDDIIANLTATATESASVNGIHFKGQGTTKISGNTIHDLNAPVTKGIFIEPSAGISTATVDNNIVTGTNAGNGVEVSAGEAALNFIAIDNTVSNWQTGFLHTATTGGTLTQTFQNNIVTDNQNGFINQTGGTLDATCNWWGDVSGPSGAGPGKGDPVSSGVVYYPWASVPELIAVNAGADATLYIGYGPASIALDPAYTVCGAASYWWSTGATTSSITVSPTVTTTYSITVNDGNGHEATDEVTVIVKDIRCGNKNDKIKVCHKDSKLKISTICIVASDVNSHLAHGDTLGECPLSTIGAREMLDVNLNETASEEFDVNVYPNPTEFDFTVLLNNANTRPVEIKVMNSQGQIVKTIKATDKMIPFGHDLKSGLYIVDVVQGLNRKTLKLIKY